MIIFLWVVASITTFAITMYLIKHSSFDKYPDKEELHVSLWVFIIFLILYSVPVLNIVVFIIFLLFYFIEWVNDELYFIGKSKWLAKLIKFLNRPII